jgi:PAS domain S-box-containing protein/putative nucleotidyltransferase with HDIG domain
MARRQRKGAEDKTLIEFEHYIKDIWAFLPTPIAYISPLGVILDSDSTLEEMLHCPKDSLVGRLLEEFFPNTEQVEEIQSETIEKGCVRNYLCRITNKADSGIPVSISTLVRKSRDGEVIGYFAAFTDVSENTRVEQLLQNRANQQRRLLETARYLAESLDIQEVLTRIATSARDIVRADGCSIYLLEADRKTLKPVVAIDPPYEEEILATRLNIDTSFTGKAIKEKQAMIFNDTANNPLGQQIPGTPEEENEHVIAAPFIVDSEIIGAMCLDRDGIQFADDDLVVCEVFATYAATALRNARTYHDLQKEVQRRESVQGALEIEKGYLEQLFESAQEGIAMLDCDGLVQRVNKEFSRIFGYTREEVLGKSIDDLIVPEESFREARLMTKRGGNGESVVLETIRRCKRGNLIDVSLLASPIIINKQQVGIYAIYRDITARKQAERELKQSEERYRTLVNTSPEAVTVTDLEGNITYVSPETLKLHGFNMSEELVGMSGMKLMDPVDHGKAVANMKETLERGMTRNIEYTLLRTDGSRFVGEVNASLIKDEKGNPQAFIVTMRDTSERKKVESDLRESEERYRDLVEKAGVAILLIDHDGKFTYYNNRFAELLGYSFDEMRKRELRSIVHPDDLDRVVKVRQGLIQGTIGALKHEFRGVRKDGSVVYLECDAISLKRDDNIIGTRSYLWDVTQRKRAEEEMKSSEERLKLLFEFAPDGYYLTDLKGNFVDGNKAYEEITGYKKQELIEMNFLRANLLSADQISKAQALLIRNANGQRTGPDEFMLTRKDGSKTIVGIRTYPVRIDGKIVVLGIARDITEYKRTQEELRKSYERMQKVLEDTINALTSAVEKRDPYTAGHQNRVALLADAIAERLNLPGYQKEGLHVAALVHDIGKINVPAGILNKPSSLSDAEFALVKDHVLVGYDILRTIEFPWQVAEIVLQHHERMDGSGYPKGTKGSGMMQEAKILAVADVVESMMAHRPYRPALGKEKAISEITRNKKKLYEAKVVNACLKVLRDRKFRF